ncbi:MAG: hypothetical protein IPP33_15425 [Flavobacteriales bacterium]|nr:hypothetical protein [Flavobacteriales bacterium]
MHGYERVVLRNIYPYIDLHVCSNEMGYKFYFVVQPGGDASQIRLKFTGQEELEIDLTGALKAIKGNRWLRLPNAIAYQVEGANTTSVPWTVDYNEITENQIVNFNFGAYDHTKPLVFDISENNAPLGGQGMLPTPEWGTYYNGNGSYMTNMAAATDGGMVTCGGTSSTYFH